MAADRKHTSLLFSFSDVRFQLTTKINSDGFGENDMQTAAFVNMNTFGSRKRHADIFLFFYADSLQSL